MYRIRTYELDILKQKQNIQLNGGSRFLELKPDPLNYKLHLRFLEYLDQPVETREIVCYTDKEDIPISQKEYIILGYCTVFYQKPEPEVKDSNISNTGKFVILKAFPEIISENRVYLMARELVY